MRIPIDRASKTPLYLQIEGFLRQTILAGTLPAYSRLPSARRLAAELGVSRVTVESAYAELEVEGLIVRRTGSGSYVNPPGPDLPTRREDMVSWPLWQREVAGEAGAARDERAAEANAQRSTETRIALRGAHDHPNDVISFTGFGDPRLFRFEEFFGAIREVVWRDGVACLEVDDDRGYPPLRASIAHILTSQGIEAHPDDVLVTSGSQQALSIVTQLLLKPGDPVLVESPTYDGAIRLFHAHGLRLIGCPTDAWGMRVERLEPLLQQHHPKLIYTVPTFHNPTGTCMSIPRRRELIDLAGRYNIPVLEDDFVGDLRYEGTVQPALKALDPGGRVIYVGTFSKLLMPGLRLGFLVAEGPVYKRLVAIKRANDLATGTLMQRALETYVTVGRYHAHLRRLCHAYRKRRDRMIQAIGESLPSDVELITPHGGLFLWLRLPNGVSATQLTPLAQANGVEFAPGTRFFPGSVDGEAYIRLNFAVVSPEQIDEGIGRLGRAIEAARRVRRTQGV